MSSCTESLNLVCKHWKASKTFYVDLGFMPVGVTAVSATADELLSGVTVEGIEVLSEDLTVEESNGCNGSQLTMGRALLVILSGGVPSDDEILITVSWMQSDGTEDSRDLRILVSGAPT